uniref:Uncharacterized protein n=1 Tax=Rhizophora mucronata TaxID=61149 RepID=A0A2P2NY74_RHIMU
MCIVSKRWPRMQIRVYIYYNEQ